MSTRSTALLLAVSVLLLAGGCARKTAAASPVAHGRQVYAKYCATCHGVAGNGYVADNAPSLRSVTFLASASDVFLRAGITRGRPGTAMAGYGRGLGGPLGPEDIEALIAFLRDAGPSYVEPPPASAIGDVKRGKTIYDAACVRCHGTQTQRSSAVHLANPVLLATASDGFLRRAVEVGRPPTSMVPWKETFTPQQIDDVVAYVRSMAVPPAVPAAVPQNNQPYGPRAPRPGPIVLNPKGRQAEFVLKEDRYVSIDVVKQALDQKRRLIIADARAPSDWLSLHITGAISTPYYDTGALDDIPNDGTWVLAYCACPHHVSGQVVDELRKRGYKHTAVIDEGVFAWQQKGYPVVAAPGSLPPPAPPPAHPAPPPAHAAASPIHPAPPAHP